MPRWMQLVDPGIGFAKGALHMPLMLMRAFLSLNRLYSCSLPLSPSLSIYLYLSLALFASIYTPYYVSFMLCLSVSTYVSLYVSYPLHCYLFLTVCQPASFSFVYA